MKDLSSLALKASLSGLYVLDQTELPHAEHWIRVESNAHMVQLIQALSVRGAPLIGVAAALALALCSRDWTDLEKIKADAFALRQARPTAVNLMNAIDRMLLVLKESGNEGPLEIKARLIRTAVEIFQEDVALCDAMARDAAEEIRDGDGVLTHCNSGGLATVGIGTALGAIILAHQQGKRIHVYVDETRPLLQGARLTAWELAKAGVPHTLICDNMAAYLMKLKKIQKVFVGADRIAANGDFANKIGTYNLAVLAKYHQIPFFVVAPSTTLDLNCPSGDQIEIEERSGEEVTRHWAPRDVRVYNPAFDVTPYSLVSKIILETPKHSGRWT